MKIQTEMSTEQNLEQTLIESLKEAELVYLLCLIYVTIDELLIKNYRKCVCI